MQFDNFFIGQARFLVETVDVLGDHSTQQTDFMEFGQCQVGRVRLSAGGEVLGTRVERRSGNPWYDESVERAIKKASPLPPPPEADEWLFVFRPEDVL